MNLHPRPTDEILARYMAGEALPNEEQEVNTWAMENEANRQELEAFQIIWKQSSSLTSSFDTDAAWKKVHNRIASHQTPVIPIQRKVNNWVWVAAASLLILAALPFLFSDSESVQYSEIVESGSSIKEVILPDSSIVQLKPNSTLRWVKDFAGNERRMEIQGEARFQVKKNPSKPFIVASGAEYVRVLGTIFQVSHELGAHSTEVLVEEGKVLLSDQITDSPNADSTAVVLVGGQSGTLQAGKKVRVKAVETSNASYAFDKMLVFENTDLKNVCLILSEAFGSKVFLSENALENCRLTATFRHQELNEILQIIATTFNLEVLKEGEKIVLHGNGC